MGVGVGAVVVDTDTGSLRLSDVTGPDGTVSTGAVGATSAIMGAGAVTGAGAVVIGVGGIVVVGRLAVVDVVRLGGGADGDGSVGVAATTPVGSVLTKPSSSPST